MNVRALLRDSSLPDIPISQLVLDSREITPGDAFIAVPGTQQDGRQFISAAFSRGAVAVLCEADDGSKPRDSRTIMLPALRSRLGELADRFYGSPSRALTVIAATGTNGKTSVVDLAAQMLRQTRGAAGSIGTLGARLDQQPQLATNTTPDCLALHRQLSEWRAESVSYVTLEASSHALDQGRLDGLSIDVGVLPIYLVTISTITVPCMITATLSCDCFAISVPPHGFTTRMIKRSRRIPIFGAMVV